MRDFRVYGLVTVNTEDRSDEEKVDLETPSSVKVPFKKNGAAQKICKGFEERSEPKKEASKSERGKIGGLWRGSSGRAVFSYLEKPSGDL